MFEASVDRLGRAVGGAGSVEEREDVDGALFQGASEASDLDERGGDAAADCIDDGLHHLLAELLVGFPVRGDHALIDAPGRFNLDVLLDGEYRLQACGLLVGEQARPGVQGASRFVERIAGATTMPEGGLLDALPAPVECLASEPHDVERIMPISA